MHEYDNIAVYESRGEAEADASAILAKLPGALGARVRVESFRDYNGRTLWTGGVTTTGTDDEITLARSQSWRQINLYYDPVDDDAPAASAYEVETLFAELDKILSERRRDIRHELAGIGCAMDLITLAGSDEPASYRLVKGAGGDIMLARAPWYDKRGRSVELCDACRVAGPVPRADFSVELCADCADRNGAIADSMAVLEGAAQ